MLKFSPERRTHRARDPLAGAVQAVIHASPCQPRHGRYSGLSGLCYRHLLRPFGSDMPVMVKYETDYSENPDQRSKKQVISNPL